MPARTPSYHVTYTLTQGGRWKAEVAEYPAVQEVRRSLAQLETRVRALIAHQGADDRHWEVAINTGSPSLDVEITRVRDLRARSADLEQQAAALAKEARTAAEPAARSLIDQGVSVRDAGSLLGYSGTVINKMTRRDPS